MTVELPVTGPYTAKDQLKADISNKFIGVGSDNSSTHAYMKAYGNLANGTHYNSSDVVFISAEGNRTGRKEAPVDLITLAAKQDVVFITDGKADRERSYNIGEREVETILKDLEYLEALDGYWISPNYPYNFPIIRGDLFTVDADAICITTNGFVKSNGDAVMGKGCAKQAATIIPELPSMLGKSLRDVGNQVVVLIAQNDTSLLSFPVKPVSKVVTSLEDDVVAHMRSSYHIDDNAPGWACKADLDIIVQSCKELVAIADVTGWKKIILPRMGCGAGELDWDTVAQAINPILDERFYVITY